MGPFTVYIYQYFSLLSLASFVPRLNRDVVVKPSENRTILGPTFEEKNNPQNAGRAFSNLATSEHVAKFGRLAFDNLRVDTLAMTVIADQNSYSNISRL